MHNAIAMLSNYKFTGVFKAISFIAWPSVFLKMFEQQSHAVIYAWFWKCMPCEVRASLKLSYKQCLQNSDYSLTN